METLSHIIKTHKKNKLPLTYAIPISPGFTRSHGTLKDGLRCSTAKAYLRPIIARHNLHVSLHSHVYRVHVETGPDGEPRAAGVVVKKGRRDPVLIRAKREVVMSAGAIGSPQVSASAELQTLWNIPLPCV